MVGEEHSFVYSVVDFKTFIRVLILSLRILSVEEQGGQYTALSYSRVDTSNLSDVSPADLTWHQVWEWSSSMIVTSFWGTPY